MRKRNLTIWVIAVTSLALIPSIAGGDEYRLFGEYFQTVGNQWQYDMHIYLLDNNPVNLWGTASLAITGTGNIAGYDTFIMDVNAPWGYAQRNLSVTPEYIIEIANDNDQGIHRVFSNNDPLEIYPIWVDDTDNNRLFGHGHYQVTLDSPPMNWTETHDSYITYLRQETVTVPTGTFECIVVFLKWDWTDSDNWSGYTEETNWIDPHLGIIKGDTLEYYWDTVSGHSSAYTWELTSTNVAPQPFCKVRSLPMDFNGDCKVNLFDFALFARSWMDCQLDPPSASGNSPNPTTLLLLSLGVCLLMRGSVTERKVYDRCWLIGKYSETKRTK